MNLDHIGGYEAKIFVVQPSDKFLCGLCLDVLKNPVQCLNGHCFCEGCIHRALQAKEKCPMCNVSLTVRTLSKNLFVRGMIEEMKTFCPSCDGSALPLSSNGEWCAWTGELHTRAKHYEESCDFKLVKCISQECDGKVQKRHHPSVCTDCNLAMTCLNDRNTSELLLVQELRKLHFLLLESACDSSTASLIVGFLKCILRIPDELGPLRAAVVLIEREFGLASRALQEKNHPTVCRSNEYNPSAVLDRYISCMQDLVSVPGFLDAMNILAETNPSVQFTKGLLRLRPDCSLTENEYVAVANCVVLVDGAGALHVNGEYRFSLLKNSAGCYERRGEYSGSPDVRYTLYKCALKSGAFQWFLSATPDDLEPGTAQDLDFYYAPAKSTDKLPPSVWQRFTSEHSCDPPPRVESIQF